MDFKPTLVHHFTNVDGIEVMLLGKMRDRESIKYRFYSGNIDGTFELEEVKGTQLHDDGDGVYFVADHEAVFYLADFSGIDPERVHRIEPKRHVGTRGRR